MTDNAEELRRAFAIELSTGGRQLTTAPLATLREIARIEIYRNGLAQHRFQSSFDTYAQAFEAAFNERLDRRIVAPPLPDPEDGDEDEE